MENIIMTDIESAIFLHLQKKQKNLMEYVQGAKNH